MSFTVRQAVRGDEQALALIGAATFLESYAGVIDGAAIVRHCAGYHTPEVYARSLASRDEALWLAEMAPGAAPAGYLHLTAPSLPVAAEPGDVEIKRIYVLSSLRGRGAGARLLALAEDHARARGAGRILLGVYKQNARALAFYERKGFVAAGEREFDVGGRVYCDWVMEKRL